MSSTWSGNSALVIVYQVLRQRMPYRELGPDYYDRLQPERRTRNLVQRLGQLGHKVALETRPTPDQNTPRNRTRHATGVIFRAVQSIPPCNERRPPPNSSGSREVTPRFAVGLAVLGARDRKSAGRFRRNSRAGRVMSTPRFTAEELDRLRALAAEWGKIVSKRAFGDDGPGLDVDFRTMEQIATAAAQGLTEGALQQMLHQQARKVPEQVPCPVCGEPCPTRPHTRTLAAQGATVQQAERIAHCPACRRDFFPPAAGPRAG
ncbi:hypothetical protein GobsT_52970 [Gemmata obscuriglobus]|nr:hypothetical protein GobsT_52970 [Gemmata obscuriglobus]VTS09816.1 Uncharacterized protein OS=Rhodopirellula sp. SWK7 GN=RRSWK_00014 PE=4 SV=1 [Gemmata obscuriglobus UQM 2246]